MYSGSLAMVTEAQATVYNASLDNGVTPNPDARLSNPFPNGILPVPGDSLGALTSYGLATLPTRLRFRELPSDRVPRSEAAGHARVQAGCGADRDFIASVVELASALARAELSARPDGLSRLLGEALDAAKGTAPRLLVRLHPEDAALMVRAGALPASLEGVPVQFAEDPACGRGGLRVETESRVIDATFETRLEALREALRP